MNMETNSPCYVIRASVKLRVLADFPEHGARNQSRKSHRKQVIKSRQL